MASSRAVYLDGHMYVGSKTIVVVIIIVIFVCKSKSVLCVA